MDTGTVGDDYDEGEVQEHVGSVGKGFRRGEVVSLRRRESVFKVGKQGFGKRQQAKGTSGVAKGTRVTRESRPGRLRREAKCEGLRTSGQVRRRAKCPSVAKRSEVEQPSSEKEISYAAVVRTDVTCSNRFQPLTCSNRGDGATRGLTARKEGHRRSNDFNLIVPDCPERVGASFVDAGTAPPRESVCMRPHCPQHVHHAPPRLLFCWLCMCVCV